MATNPYRWQHDQPAHVVAREALVGKIEDHLRRGVAVKLIGGRGMGKSVLLRQIQARFADEPDTRALLVPRPAPEGTLAAYVQDISARLGLAALTRTTLDAVMEAAAERGISRLILLVDEADQYVLMSPTGDLARTWFNHIEALRKAWMGRIAVVVAGGLGLLHLGHVLGSGLVSRAETCVAERFTFEELRHLADPFARQGEALSDDVLQTLEALSGGNPALATYGLEQLWTSSGEPIPVLREVFGEFASRHHDFLRAVHDAVSHRGLVKAPGRILQIVRQRAGSVPQQELRDACAADDPPVSVLQAIQLLQAAGLVGVTSSVHADPLQIHPIASIANLPTEPAAALDPADRLDADVAAVLAQLHRFGRDFHGKQALLEEQVFSSLLATGLALLGWPAVDREAVQSAGYADLRVGMTRDGVHGHALIEMKLWPRNDYKDLQSQLDAYRVSNTVHTIGVMVGVREVAGWADDYERECLARHAASRRPTPPDLVGCWHVETTNPTTGLPRTTHYLVQIPKRG
jgi:hypothetical protein